MGIASLVIGTQRLQTHLLTGGAEDGAPVLFIHGNVSSSRFWEEILDALPAHYRGLAPDLRGFGSSETKPVDATRGLRDFSDDLHSPVEALGLLADGRRLHLVGWSVGGGVAMQYAIDRPAQVPSWEKLQINEDFLAQRSVPRISLFYAGRLTAARRTHEHQRWFRHLQHRHSLPQTAQPPRPGRGAAGEQVKIMKPRFPGSKGGTIDGSSRGRPVAQEHAHDHGAVGRPDDP